MKTRLFPILLILALSFSAQAQKHGIGMRFSPESVKGSYVRNFSEKFRLGLDFGAYFEGYSTEDDVMANMGLVAELSFVGVKQLGGPESPIYFYGGGGLAFGAGYINVRGGVFAQLGFEYRFPKAPVTIAIDYRPSVMLYIPDTDIVLHGRNVGLTVRYLIPSK